MAPPVSQELGGGEDLYRYSMFDRIRNYLTFVRIGTFTTVAAVPIPGELKALLLLATLLARRSFYPAAPAQEGGQPLMSERTLDELTPLEGLCLLASKDGGRVDLSRERSPRAAQKIQDALDAGAIDGEGWLTEKGKRLAEGEMTDV